MHEWRVVKMVIASFLTLLLAETMHTQVVDEGISITILCNVTQNNMPSGATNLRYAWHNPNGTLVGNQWFLRISNIRLHESGVYVCTASVDADGTIHEASKGTHIVVKRGKF